MNSVLSHELLILKIFESVQMTVCNIKVKFVGVIVSINNYLFGFR